jgi:hypothetical protein
MQMVSRIKWAAISKLRIGNLYADYSTSKNLLKMYSHSKSIRAKSPLGLTGNPLPWYTYPAMEYLESIDFSKKSAFEYGSGNSTLWWASEVESLVSVESDSKWHQKISSGLLQYQNVNYSLISDSPTYVHSSWALKSDIVIIDGESRSECARFMVENPNLCSFLIFDNSDWYPETIKFLSANLQDSTRVDFSGFGPINTYTWTTSIFISRKIPQIEFKSPIGSRAGITSKSAEDY